MCCLLLYVHVCLVLVRLEYRQITPSIQKVTEVVLVSKHIPKKSKCSFEKTQKISKMDTFTNIIGSSELNIKVSAICTLSAYDIFQTGRRDT